MVSKKWLLLWSFIFNSLQVCVTRNPAFLIHSVWLVAMFIGWDHIQKEDK